MNRTETRKKQWMLILCLLGFMPVIFLRRIIGNLGIAYFAVAAECVLLFYAFFLKALPDSIEKLMKSRFARGQYKNADKIFSAGLIYAGIVGVSGSILLCAAASTICRSFKVPEATLVLRILAFVLVFEGISAVFKGLFQSNGSFMPTVTAGVLKQLFGLLFAALFGYMMYGYGEKTSALLHNSKFAAMYGAAGAALGFLLASFLSFAFLLLLYIGAGRRLRKKKQEGMRLTEDGLEVYRLLLSVMLPASAVYFFRRAGLLLGLPIYIRAQAEGMLVPAMEAFGAFYGQYLVLAGIIVTVAGMVIAGTENNVRVSMRKEENKAAKSNLTGGMQGLFMLTGFFAILLLVFAPNIIRLLFEENEQAAACLRQGALVVLLLPLGLYFLRILEGIGKKVTVLITTTASFVTFLLVFSFSCRMSEGSVVCFAHALTGLALVMCLANGFILMQTLKYTPNWLHLFVFPAIALAVTGLCLLLLGKALLSLAGDLITLLIAAVLGSVCYLVLLFVLKCITEKDLYVLPGGKLLKRVGTLFHLF